MSTVDLWREGMRAHGDDPDMVNPDECRNILARLKEALAMDASMGVLEPILAHTDTCPHCNAEAHAIQNIARMGDHIQTRSSVADLYVYHRRSRSSLDSFCRSRLTHPR